MPCCHPQRRRFAATSQAARRPRAPAAQPPDCAGRDSAGRRRAPRRAIRRQTCRRRHRNPAQRIASGTIETKSRIKTKGIRPRRNEVRPFGRTLPRPIRGAPTLYWRPETSEAYRAPRCSTIACNQYRHHLMRERNRRVCHSFGAHREAMPPLSRAPPSADLREMPRSASAAHLPP